MKLTNVISLALLCIIVAFSFVTAKEGFRKKMPPSSGKQNYVVASNDYDREFDYDYSFL